MVRTLTLIGLLAGIATSVGVGCSLSREETDSSADELAREGDAGEGGAPADGGPAPQLLLNELKVTASAADAKWEFAELSCTKGVKPAATYFVALDTTGTASMVVNLSSRACGANGLVLLRPPGEGHLAIEPATVTIPLLAPETGPTQLANAKGAFLVVFSPTEAIVAGTSYDDGAGKLKLPEGAKVIDGLAFDAASKYAPVVQPAGARAATRIATNTTPSSAAAFYAGSLKGGADALEYDRSQSSANLPDGAKLTPGAPNAAKRNDPPPQDSGAQPAQSDAGSGDKPEPAAAGDDDSASGPSPANATPPAAPTAPGLKSADSVCAATSGPAAPAGFSAVALLGVALAAVRRRRRA